VTENEQVKSNIWKYYLATALVHFGFFTPIIQLFYLANDLTIVKIAFLGVIWNLIRIILEVPSGILADKWGRKNVLLISSIFAIVQVVILMWANAYWHFFIASIVSAVAYSFLSGTDIAFFYDTLKQLKREKEFEKLWARQHIYQQVPLIIAFASSGFLYKFSRLLPFQLSLIFLIASLVVILTFKEPKFHKPMTHVNVFTHFAKSARHIFENNPLKTMLVFTIIFSIGSDLSYGYGQIYLKQLALPVVLFGIAYTFKSLLVTTAANIAPSLRRRWSYQNIFALQIVLITVLFYVMVLTKSYMVGAISFVLIAIPHGLFIISKSSYVHEHTPSHRRATVDSMFSFMVALVILVLEPATGYLADVYTMKVPFLLIAIILSIYCVYYLIHGRKKI
jgi:MFS family permease